ncbi:hypothetical protein ACHWQZ_G003438 [Mnemiopsis leidyi]
MKLEVDPALLEDTDVILLCVGNHQFSAPRPLLAHHSTHLAQQLDEENVLMITEFHDVPDIFEMGLDLLKGREVEVKECNYKGLLKFAVLCKVCTLHAKLLDWLREEFRSEKISFLKMFEISNFILTFNVHSTEILDFCRDQLDSRGLFIIDRELEHCPETAIDSNFISLLVHPTYIWSTLPLLQKIISDQPRAEIVLDLINNSDILSTLKHNKLFTVDFLSRLRVLLMQSDTKHLMLLIKIQEKLLRGMSVTPRYRIMPLLTSEEYLGSPERRAACLALSPEKMLKLKRNLNLKDVVYCELLIDWLKARYNDPSKKAQFIYKVWEQVDFHQLSRGYVYDFKQSLEKFCRGEQLNLVLPAKNHVCAGYGFYLTEHQTYALRLGHPVLLEHHCNICECEETSPQGLCLQLCENTPCYTLAPTLFSPKCHYHTQPTHWWFSEDGNPEIISLITNSLDQIKSFLARAQRVYVCGMGPMVNNPVFKPRNSISVVED